jgi:hypothetical protein
VNRWRSIPGLSTNHSIRRTEREEERQYCLWPPTLQRDHKEISHQCLKGLSHEIAKCGILVLKTQSIATARYFYGLNTYFYKKN